MGMKFLQENLLDHLKRPEFSSLLNTLQPRRYSKGAFIAQPDSRNDQIFIVAQGRLRIYLGYEDKEFNLGILTQGDIYSTHSGTYVEALEDSELLCTDVHSFRQQMIDDAEISKAMIRVLGSILKASFSIIDGLVFKDVNYRLIFLLSSEARKQSIDDKRPIHLRLNLSIEQLARLVGSSRQTVSTLINDLTRAGLIERPARGEFLIPDLTALESIGGLTPEP